MFFGGWAPYEFLFPAFSQPWIPWSIFFIPRHLSPGGKGYRGTFVQFMLSLWASVSPLVMLGEVGNEDLDVPS